MRSLIITVAGLSSRFNRDLDKPVLKCLYYRKSYKASLLYQLVRKAGDIDEIVIVGGYLYNDLEKFVRTYFSKSASKIRLVFNQHFDDFGSGYSLLKGIENVNDLSDEVIFVEGDLFFDMESFKEVIYSSKNVITINHEPIYADKAVAIYLSEKGNPRYIYDTSHEVLQVNEPFKAIFNSGQIWKFLSVRELKKICKTLSEPRLQGTNLEIIQTYFNNMNIRDIDIVTIRNWINCNTVADYDKVENQI